MLDVTFSEVYFIIAWTKEALLQPAEVLTSWPTVLVPEKHNISNSALQGKAE